jgi:hypothetical protein
MATFIPFTPSNLFVPSFVANFDGDDYTVKISWNISAQRFYINIYAGDGTWIVTVPLIQSPPSRGVASVAWDILQGTVSVQMVDPSLWPIPLSPAALGTPPGTIIEYTLENFVPDTYNGKFRGLHINPTLFTIPMTSDPGQAQILGSVSRHLNMVAGIFNTSTFIYRNGNFEVNP